MKSSQVKGPRDRNNTLCVKSDKRNLNYNLGIGKMIDKYWSVVSTKDKSKINSLIFLVVKLKLQDNISM